MPHPPFDPSAHRRNTKYSRDIFLKRILWTVVRPFFHLSPRPCYGWRNFLLRLFGARIGKAVRLYPSIQVFFPWNLEVEDRVTVAWGVRLYSLGKITLREGCMISQHASLCAGSHDYRKPNRPLITPPIEIGVGAWVASEAFIGPGVTIGDQTVIGARAVVVKDVPPFVVAMGNPAQVRQRTGETLTDPHQDGEA